MQTSDFDYALPPELIASEPVQPRDASRMMVLDRGNRSISHATFRDLPSLLRPSDVLIVNDTRVLKARLYGKLERASGTTREIECLFVTPKSTNVWEVLCKPGKSVRKGDRIIFDESASARVGISSEGGLRQLEFDAAVDVAALMERCGHVPLPPYIDRADTPRDLETYQTMFASQPGAVAAPTAGLHFTPDLLRALQDCGISVGKITLHVGIGTFQPVRNDDPRKHFLKPEWFHISEETAGLINQAKRGNQRVIGVGTTTTRTLEHAVGETGVVAAGSGMTSVYILPGHRFRAIDCLITNFHLPRSTLLMLVSAFASREFVREAYQEAVKQHYRFYSYGDCMLIL